MLLDYQKKNLEILKYALKSHKHISIVGKPYSGRTTVVSNLQNNKTIVIKILPKSNGQIKYEDILSAVNDIKNFKKSRHEITLSISLSGGVAGIALGKHSNDLFSIENEFIKRLKRLSFRKNVILVIKNPQFIDIGTQNIINRIKEINCQSLFSRKHAIIEICDSKHEATGDIVYFDSLTDDKTEFSNVLRMLNLNPNITLSSYVLSFIQKNANGNISLILKIINDLNENVIDANFDFKDSNSHIKALICNSINSSDFKDKLYEILTIMAICNRYFNNLDLSFLLEENSNIVELYLQYAIEHKFIENADGRNEYYIFLGIVKEIFSSAPANKKLAIYNKVIKLIETFYLDQYKEKYTFSMLAEDGNGSVYFMQHLMKEIRSTGKYNKDQCKEALNKVELSIIDNYYIAYSKANSNQYNEAILILKKTIFEYSLTSPIKQEFQLFISQCLIKSIIQRDRQEAVELLCYDNTDVNIDEYLKYRLDTRKIAALIHIGKYDEARKQSNLTEDRLLNNIKHTKSPGCEYYLNVIYRKYCNVHPYESSIFAIKKSVEFFSENPHYVRSLYIALNNLLALELINGKYDDANKTISKIEELKEKNFCIRFPRTEIYNNNYLLAKLINNGLSVDVEFLKDFELSYKNTSSADHILISSNYAIVLALYGNLNEALNVLTSEYIKLQKTSDLEGIYAYRIITNLAVLKFIQDNSKRDNCLTMLSQISIKEEDFHNFERSKERTIIIKTMQKLSSCSSLLEWINACQQNLETPTNYFRLYEYGIVFTTLFDWDDE